MYVISMHCATVHGVHFHSRECYLLNPVRIWCGASVHQINLRGKHLGVSREGSMLCKYNLHGIYCLFNA